MQSADEWAHIIPKPEKGALLLAHPLLFQNSQTYFHRAAILLLEHGDNGRQVPHTERSVTRMGLQGVPSCDAMRTHARLGQVFRVILL